MDAPKKPARATNGFSSSAKDATEATLAVHDLLVKRLTATVFLRMCGDMQAPAELSAGDILAVDRWLPPMPGRLMIVAMDSALRVMRWQPARPGPPQGGAVSEDARETSEVIWWGVVTSIIHPPIAPPSRTLR